MSKYKEQYAQGAEIPMNDIVVETLRSQLVATETSLHYTSEKKKANEREAKTLEKDRSFYENKIIELKKAIDILL